MADMVFPRQRAERLARKGAPEALFALLLGPLDARPQESVHLPHGHAANLRQGADYMSRTIMRVF
jgi:hypothetical protein